MASQSLVAFLAEAGAKIESRSNGEPETVSQNAAGSAQEKGKASPPPLADAPATSPIPTGSATPLPVPAAHEAPAEEVQKNEKPSEPVVVVVQNIEKPLEPDNAVAFTASVPTLVPAKTGSDPPLEEINRAADMQEEDLPPEVDAIQVPPHWHPKPCVHISSIGGPMTEEELLPLFRKYGPISSVSFENERHDAALIRYELHLENGEELLAQVRQATNSTKLGDRTLIVEPFRPDSLLFVGNLTPNIDDASLQAMFEPHGKIERAFVLQNAEGHSKCYGFVEYSLKTQATAAKMAMGNINMDGRVLRVEWSDCKKVADMFSTILFIDRLPREGPHIEAILRELFGNYGKVRDCHLAIGIGNQFRGFAFIDFHHSTSADKAHRVLDGHVVEGSNIRVSFANPSKSAQSYKFRYGSQAAQAFAGRGGIAGSGMLMGPSVRGPTPIPLMPSRFMSPARPGMLGFGIGMQFGRGSFERGTVSALHSSAGGMLGPASGVAGRASLLLGNMAPRAGMAVGENSMKRLPFGQGAVSITPSAIVQVATAQAKAREEEAKARAEAAKHGVARQVLAADFSSVDQYQKFQQGPQQNYHQQQQTTTYDQHYKQADSSYAYHQAYQHSTPQQASLQPQYQAWNQQQHTQQALQAQRMQHYSHPSQNFSQQQQVQQADQGTQYSQNDGYYQQTTQQSQYSYPSQYGQQQGYQYGPEVAQTYGQTVQQTGQQYQHPTQEPQAAYPQQNYSEQYVQTQQASQQSYSGATITAVSSGGSSGQDAAQQQAYAAYYQQQAQAATSTPVASGTMTSSTTLTTQQSYEAQWAAYYASQAAYQQQTSTADVGQKRAADQMEPSAQNQASYNYAGYSQQGGIAYQQQQSQLSTNIATPYQVQAANTTATYQQQAALAATAYQQQGALGATGIQQAGAAASYLPPTASGQSAYEQSIPSAADGYQQPATATPGAFQVGVQGQTGVYDYSKRPRY